MGHRGSCDGGATEDQGGSYGGATEEQGATSTAFRAAEKAYQLTHEQRFKFRWAGSHSEPPLLYRHCNNTHTHTHTHAPPALPPRCLGVVG